MDGVHDLGGRFGFGPVDVNEPEEQFHHDWEGRTLAIIRAMARPAPWSLDWFRHVRELIEPADYLSRPYYDQWLQTYAAMLIDSGAATVEEIATGKAKTPGAGKPMDTAGVAVATGKLALFDRPDASTPRFKQGENVRTLKFGAVGHTRLPQYARDRVGRVIAVRGNFILPDFNMKDDGPAEMLYTVAFAASELWPEAKASRDTVHIDLWESYLEPA